MTIHGNSCFFLNLLTLFGVSIGKPSSQPLESPPLHRCFFFSCSFVVPSLFLPARKN